MTAPAQEKLAGVKHEGVDFSGHDLKGRDLSHSVFVKCNFDRANLTSANCEGSDFTCSTFRKSYLTYANFKDAKMAGTVFEPTDCYGITLTMHCKTFENVNISLLHWYSWLVLTVSMTPTGMDGIKLRDQLIGVIGAERWVKLRELFGRRNV